MHWLQSFTGPLIAACALSCSTPSQGFRPQPRGDAPIVWSACPAELGHSPQVECALVEVPVDWDAPDRDAVVVFARRVRIPGSRGQLWAFDGGPGAAGDGFLSERFLRLARALALDVYVPTHRGVAYGTRLSCPIAQSTSSPGAQRVTAEEWPGCAAELRERWGEQLALFNSRQAARDVQRLMAGAPGAGPRVLFAGSYGTWWAQRVLQLGVSAALVVLDSVIDLNEDVGRQDYLADTAGKRLLAQCQSSSCARLASGPITEIAARVFDRLRAQEGCGGGSASEGRALLAFWLDGAPADRALIAPWLARMDRCSAEDRAALAAARARFRDVTKRSMSTVLFNPIFNKHLIALEMFNYARGRAQLQADLDAAWFSFDVSLPLADIAAAFGEDRALKPSVELPSTNTPMLVLHGRLDPRGLPQWAERVAERWQSAGAAVELVVYESAGHSTPRYTLLGESSCSEQLIAAKLAAPAVAIDRTCVRAAPPVDFAGTTQASIAAATEWFGTGDAWGGLLEN